MESLTVVGDQNTRYPKTFMVLSIYIFLQLIYVLRFSAAFNVGGYAIHLEGLLYR